MIIKEVNIQNFFCYIGENKFFFTKGLNIISGRNSSGKSQFFNAFYWTFFEQIYSDENSTAAKKRWISAKNLSIYPEALFHKMNLGEQFTTAVDITFDANDYKAPSQDAEDSVTYNFRREITFRKSDRGLTTVLPSELKIEYILDGETFIVNRADHEMLLDQIFPRSIRKFMWYQGETMDELYDFSNDSTLKNAINEIPIFQSMIS